MSYMYTTFCQLLRRFSLLIGILFITCALCAQTNDARWYTIDVMSSAGKSQTSIQEEALSKLWIQRVGRALNDSEKSHIRGQLLAAFDIIKKRANGYRVYLNKAVIERYWQNNGLHHLESKPKHILWMVLEKQKSGSMRLGRLDSTSLPEWLLSPMADLQDEAQLPGVPFDLENPLWLNAFNYFKSRYHCDYVFVTVRDAMPLINKAWLDYYLFDGSALNAFRSDKLSISQIQAGKVSNVLFAKMLNKETDQRLNPHEMSIVFINRKTPETLMDIPQNLAGFAKIETHIKKLQPHAMTLQVKGVFKKDKLRSWMEKELLAVTIQEETSSLWKVYLP